MDRAVVLAHGLFMRKEIMFYLKSAFTSRGYRVYNFDYNTLKFNEDTLNKFKLFVEENIKEPNVYFVGHSMGGLLMKAYIEREKPTFKDMCLVTLASPHKGSSFGKMVEDSKIGFIMGTAPDSGITTGSFKWSGHCPLGCIVGVKNLGLNSFFNNKTGAGDGTVLKEEAFDDNADDIIEIDVNHTGMVYSRKAVDQSICFFKTKKFFQI